MIKSFSDNIHNTTPLVALVIAMTLSMLVIPIVWRFAARLGMIDQPDVRKVHTHSIPRVGGLGILIGAILSIIVMLDIGQQEVAFLIFMVPLPNFLYFNLSQKLQLISSSICVEVIRLFGVSVFLEGNVIDLGNYKLQVVDACRRSTVVMVRWSG